MSSHFSKCFWAWTTQVLYFFLSVNGSITIIDEHPLSALSLTHLIFTAAIWDRNYNWEHRPRVGKQLVQTPTANKDRIKIWTQAFPRLTPTSIPSNSASRVCKARQRSSPHDTALKKAGQKWPPYFLDKETGSQRLGSWAESHSRWALTEAQPCPESLSGLCWNPEGSFPGLKHFSTSLTVIQVRTVFY